VYNYHVKSGERDRREEETCRDFVLPALGDAGWTDDQISAEYPITGGRIRATARYFERDMQGACKVRGRVRV